MTTGTSLVEVSSLQRGASSLFDLLAPERFGFPILALAYDINDFDDFSTCALRSSVVFVVPPYEPGGGMGDTAGDKGVPTDAGLFLRQPSALEADSGETGSIQDRDERTLPEV
jgi:hypothetical protein